MTSTAGKQTQAELILAALPEQERRDAALCFYKAFGRGMSNDEIIQIAAMADHSQKFSFGYIAQRHVQQLQLRDKMSELKQEALL